MHEDNSAAIFIAQRIILDEIILENWLECGRRQIFVNVFVLDSKFVEFLDLFEGTFRVEFAWTEKCDAEEIVNLIGAEIVLGWNGKR